jgi:hypothetical protein
MTITEPLHRYINTGLKRPDKKSQALPGAKCPINNSLSVAYQVKD